MYWKLAFIFFFFLVLFFPVSNIHFSAQGTSVYDSILPLSIAYRPMQKSNVSTEVLLDPQSPSKNEMLDPPREVIRDKFLLAIFALAVRSPVSPCFALQPYPMDFKSCLW